MMETFSIIAETEILIRTLLLGVLGFLVSMLVTPLYTALAFRGQWWKKSGHHERFVPTMAGAVMVVSIAIITIAFNLERSQTWLPLAAFVGAAAVGLLDDVLRLKRAQTNPDKPLPSKRLKLLLTTIVASIGGWFFYYKLDISSIHIPLVGSQLEVGWLIIPLFIFAVVASAHAVDVSDGLDGLAGGLATFAFAVYATIAGLEGNYGIAAFCLTIVGGLLSYTWFNINPARFFMGSVGSIALGTALGVVAMLTNTLLLLPIIGAVFVLEAGSTIVQRASRALRGGREVFLAVPLHRHFEAAGWPDTKVTMRFWILGQVAAVLGLTFFLLGNYF